MSLINFNFYSETLCRNAQVDIILPTAFFGSSSMGISPPYKPAKTIYLLHGICGDNTEWQRGTQIELFCNVLGVAAVMPNIENSFGVNIPNGENFFNFLCDELPGIIESHFLPISNKREDKCICGYSMGGYAALNIASKRPDVFGYCAAMSAVVKPQEAKVDGFVSELAKQVVEKTKPEELTFNKNLPKLHISCGKSDPLLEQIQALKSLDCTYEEHEGGHDLIFWNAQIPRILEWFTKG